MYQSIYQRSYKMKTLFAIVLGIIVGSVAFGHNDEPAKLLKETQVCEDIKVPVYGMIERPASDGEVFSGLVIGGLIGNQFGSGSGNDAMTFLGAILGADSASERKRQKVITGYKKVKHCWTEYQ